jgi:hypothetical protein
MSGAAVAIAVASARRRIAAHFTTAGATDAAHAITFEPRPRRLDRRLFRRLVAFGALVEAGGGRYWLDECRLADFRKENAAKVIGILAVAGLAAAAAIGLAP